MYLLFKLGDKMETKIKEFRNKANLTQQEFADKLSLTQSGLGHYESGRRKVSLAMARRIVRALNDYKIKCDLDDVFPIEK